MIPPPSVRQQTSPSKKEIFNKIDDYLTNKITKNESPTRGESKQVTKRGENAVNTSMDSKNNKYRRYFSETKIFPS